MNFYDSARIKDVLAPFGWKLTEDTQKADMVLINTCHIREKAEEKLFSELGRWAMVKRHRPQLILAVAGCVAQAQGDEIIRRQPMVDLVVGTGSYHRIAQMVAAAEQAMPTAPTQAPTQTQTTQNEPSHQHNSGQGSNKPKWGNQLKSSNKLNIDLEFPAIPKFDSLPQPQTSEVSAYLSIQEGCDKFCTFCVVPYTRGAEYSRPVAQVLTEAKSLLAQGVCEITLLGQNVNAYHGADGKKSCSLGQLIFKLAELDGIKRIRYTTSHPKDMHPELYQAHKEVPQLMPFIHLPPQSGSDKILRAMNRKHTSDAYRKIIGKLMETRQDLALGGDFIVAFPEESEQDFRQTLKLAEELPFAHSYSFIYSPRSGTPAAVMKGQIAPSVAKQRLHRLQEVLSEKRRKFNQSFVGKPVEVLVETENGEGKTPYMQRVKLTSPINPQGEPTPPSNPLGNPQGEPTPQTNPMPQANPSSGLNEAMANKAGFEMGGFERGGFKRGGFKRGTQTEAMVRAYSGSHLRAEPLQ